VCECVYKTIFHLKIHKIWSKNSNLVCSDFLEEKSGIDNFLFESTIYRILPFPLISYPIKYDLGTKMGMNCMHNKEIM
jgi:hypothetical protein